MFLLLLLGLGPVVLAALGALIAFAIERGREVRRHARILAELGTPTQPSLAFGMKKDAVVTLEGRLANENAGSVTSFHPYGSSFLDEANVYAITYSSPAVKDFAIELAGGVGRVVLDGPTQVLRGAVETEHTAELDEGARALDAEPLARAKVKLKKRVGQFRVVRPGDLVRVRGAIQPAPDDDALYRERSNVLRMTPAPSESAGEMKIISIAATTTRARRIGARRWVPFAAGAVVGAGLAAFGAGSDLPARKHNPHPTNSVASNAKPPEPACRAPVLGKLSRFGADDATTTALVKECDDAYARAMTHYAVGNFVAASEAFKAAVAKDPALVPTLAEVETHLFVHSFADAASTVRRMNAQFYPGPSTEEKRHLECILDLLELRAKRSPSAAASDGGSPEPRFVKVCATRPFAKLARVLDSNGTYRGEDDWPRPTFQRDTRYDAVNLPYTAVVATRSRLLARPVALERDLLDRILLNNKVTDSEELGSLYLAYEADSLFPIMASWAAELTLFYAYAGFPERSAQYWPILDRVAKVVESGGSFTQRAGAAANPATAKELNDDRVYLNHVMSIAGAAALYSNDQQARMMRYTGAGEPYSSQATRQMHRVVKPSSVWEDPVVDRAWPEHQAVFEAANSGNAEGVVRVLTEHHSTGRTTLARALAHLGVYANRAALQRWFRGDAYPPACPSCGASMFLGDLSDRREVARLLDEKAENDRLREAAARFTTALTDPELGFELDELETFFTAKKK